MLLNCGVGEDSWESLELQGDHPSVLKEISPGCSLEGLMLKLKLPILWSPDEKGWLIWKDPDAGKDWRQQEKGTTEDKTVGWHHRLNGHGFGWTLGVGDGQGGLVCCGSWGLRESDTTERLNWTENIFFRNHFIFSCFLKIYFWLHWVFGTACGVCLVVEGRGYSLVVVHERLTAVASLYPGGSQAIDIPARVVAARELSSWQLAGSRVSRLQ